MDNETQAETLRSIYSSAPGKAWRLYRLTLVDTFSGDAAQEACTAPPGNRQSRRSVAHHEIGHALAKFLVRGRSGSVALCSWGGLFRTMGVTLIDDAICHQVRKFVRHWGRQRRRSRYAENVTVSLIWTPSRGVDAEASTVRYL